MFFSLKVKFHLSIPKISITSGFDSKKSRDTHKNIKNQFLMSFLLWKPNFIFLFQSYRVFPIFISNGHVVFKKSGDTDYIIFIIIFISTLSV